MMFRIYCLLAAFLLVSPAAAQTEADLRQQKTDAVEFKHRLFRLLQSHDRRQANAADIESAMGGGFVTDAVTATDGMPAAATKRVAQGFRSMGGVQYVIPLADLGQGSLPIELRSATLYGFDMKAFATYGDSCLTLDDVRYNFRGAYGWSPVGSVSGPVGIRGEREGATVIAIVEKTFPANAKDQAEMDRLLAQDKSLDRVERQRLEVLKSKINGCVTNLDLF
ncbi:hypothetical protein ABI_27210 [Asticcacaulis biprosthecium C19]|uniref:Uncharacterized protein n=1 Tax=Asticcacaulis biprosthecium C19 TaxID=715226 RepID=F4QM65_9CAUL|nr:hypothetical protein [Asticcacaulis biprosthecium]EGF91306.1 hypothetical protein ABI_27210 [Asticcacaulis biprosthecium C19]